MRFVFVNDQKIKVKCPSSKSMTQRALVMAALSGQRVRIFHALLCDDSRILMKNLEKWGVLFKCEEDDIEVFSPSSFLPCDSFLYCENAGTSLRFLACMSLCQTSPVLLEGNERMRERPVLFLGEALERCGATCEYFQKKGYPPFKINPPASFSLSSISCDISLSSQYMSGLMMVAPCLGSLEIKGTGKGVSLSYLEMTYKMMQKGGISIEQKSIQEYFISKGNYFQENDFIEIEPDWSAMSYLWVMEYLYSLSLDWEGKETSLQNSCQGDSCFYSFLEDIKRGNEKVFDLQDCPDLLIPLALCAFKASVPLEIRKVPHARLKECDRIHALVVEFQKLGMKIEEFEDGLKLYPWPLWERVSIKDPLSFQEKINLKTYQDHRMAMAFGVLSLGLKNIEIDDYSCVSKSFPSFWEEINHIQKGVL